MKKVSRVGLHLPHLLVILKLENSIPENEKIDSYTLPHLLVILKHEGRKTEKEEIHDKKRTLPHLLVILKRRVHKGREGNKNKKRFVFHTC